MIPHNYTDVFEFQPGDIVRVKPYHDTDKVTISTPGFPWVYEAEVLQYRHANHIKVKYLNIETKYEEYVISQGYILLSEKEKRNIKLNRILR